MTQPKFTVDTISYLRRIQPNTQLADKD